MISKLLCNDNPLVFSPQLAQVLKKAGIKTDPATAATIVQQIHYWLSKQCGRIVDGIRWIYNTYDQWLKQFPWLTNWKLRKIFHNLRDLNVLKFEQHDSTEWNQRGYYTIDYERLEQLHRSICGNANDRCVTKQIIKDGEFQLSYIETEITCNTTSKTTTNDGVVEEENIEEIKDAIANSPFMREDIGTDSLLQASFERDERSSAPPQDELKKHKGNFNSSEPIKVESNNSQITIFHRLRDLGISDYSKVRSLVKQTPRLQLESNIQALEELTATKELKNPLAAFFACVKDNWQPRNDKQSWWSAAAAALGRERRDRLIVRVTELHGRVMVCFTNDQMISFDQAIAMDWDAIAQMGEQ